MYRDDCKYFVTFETERGDYISFCKRETNRRCQEGPITTCADWHTNKKKRKWLPQFIKEEEFSV